MIHPIATDDPSPPVIEGTRVRLIGRFVSVSRRETAAAVERRGALVDDAEPDWIVVGEETEAEERRSAEAVAQTLGVECFSESELWRRLGLVDDAGGVRRLYSPAMLSELVDAPVAAIRRWARSGVLRPACRVNRLAYFDFEEARLAQLLSDLLKQRGSLLAVDREIDKLHRAAGGVDRPLAELPLAVIGGELLVRSADRLAEATGQRCFLFDPEADQETTPVVLRMPEPSEAAPDSIVDRAWELSDSGHLSEAIEAWRLAMLESIPMADDHFTLAEWLYLDGQLSAARERYYSTLELDGEHLEARVSLGCVLADLGDTELAIASLLGALDHHEDFADARYHVARLLTSSGRAADAAPHWRRFLEVAPENPWADEARRALRSGPEPAPPE